MAKLTKRPREWNDEAPIRVEATRDIDAPAEAVWAVLEDHETWPDWFAALKKVEVTGAASGVGAERRVHLKPFGQFDEEFYAWDPGRAFGFSLLEGSAPIMQSVNELITITDRDGGVTVHYLQAIEPKSWAGPLVKLMAINMRRALAKGLEGLAERAEA